MAKCGYCGSTIIVGGVREGDQRFCNQRCHRKGQLVALSRQIDPGQVQLAVSQIRQGLCPKCNGSGPVDVTTSYKVWSALLLTSWSSSQEICCRSCGRKRQVEALFFSALAGWWGFPWGLVMTPVQVARNVSGLFRHYDPYQPSAQLESAVRLTLANQLVQQAGETKAEAVASA